MHIFSLPSLVLLECSPKSKMLFSVTKCWQNGPYILMHIQIFPSSSRKSLHFVVIYRTFFTDNICTLWLSWEKSGVSWVFRTLFSDRLFCYKVPCITNVALWRLCGIVLKRQAKGLAGRYHLPNSFFENMLIKL